MKQWRVECHGEAREVYVVEAETAEEAMQKWGEDEPIVSECSDMEPISAVEDS